MIKKLILMMVLVVFHPLLNADTDNFISIFANKSVVIQKTTYDDIRRLFTLTFNKWDDGTWVNIVLRNQDSPLHKEFVWEYMGMSPIRYQEIIDTHISSGRAKQPIITETETETISKLANVPGSIGYLNNFIVITNYDNEIKILIVE